MKTRFLLLIVDTVPSSGRYLCGVRAFNADGMSGLSNPVTVKVP